MSKRATPMRAPSGRSRGTLSRRALLRAGGGALAAGSVLGGAAPSLLTRAAAAPVKLVFQPWYNFSNATTPAGIALMHQGLQPWLARNKGVEVQIITLGYQGAMLVALLSGAGPDVFADWVLPPYVDQRLVYNIAPLVKQDNIDLSIFPGGEMGYFYEVGGFEAPGALHALPSYLHLEAPAVNLGILDQLGLKYPEPDWTYQQWTRLWEQVTVKKGPKQRFGGAFNWDGYDYAGASPSAYYLVGFGGGYVDPADPTKSYLGAPGSIEALTWIYNLVQESVMNGGNFGDGSQVTTPIDTAGGLIGAAASWRSLKWDIFPEPVYPKGRYAYAASDFYAINAATKRPDLAWSLMKYLCVEKPWQQHMMKIAMAGPNQKGLWEQYAFELQQVAPPLRGKNLLVYNDQVQANEPTFGLAFRYAEAQATSIIARYSGLVSARKMTWAQAGPQAAREINAAEALGPAEAAAASKAISAYTAYLAKAKKAKGPLTLPTPAKQDVGAPASPALKLVSSDAAKGTYTLKGAGAGVVNTADGGTYAAAAYTSSRGTFTARLVSITVPKGFNTAGAKCGLMARSSLSTGATMASLEVSNGWNGGVHFETRPVLGQLTVDGWRGHAGETQPVSSTAQTGLIGRNVLINGWPPYASGGNILLKPLWLRLVTNGGYWTGYTSLDGRHWAEAGSARTIEAVGFWIGLWASSHSSGQYVTAVFDHVQGFTPDTFVQVGAP